jgi:chitin disaccharide deacetylase
MTRLLVVTADDLGLTDGVNAAVREAHLSGVVTATSLLAVGRAFDGAAAMLRATPTLDVGAHLALVGEDPPLLPAREIPTLVDAQGAFPLSYRTVVARAAAGRIDPDDVRRELTAQLERVVALGLPVTHLDTHQHTHLWPLVGRIVTDLAVRYSVPVVRLPTSRGPGPVGLGVRLLSRRLARTLDEAGLVHSDAYAGLDESGSLGLGALARALAAAARDGAATLEVNAHPGVADDPDSARFDWGFHWARELAALTDPRARELVERHGFRLASVRELGAARR